MRLFDFLVHGAVAAAISFSVLAVQAQPATGDGPKKPPAEAFAACKAASADSECSFTDPRGPHQGTCWAPQGKPLACKPKDRADQRSAPDAARPVIGAGRSID